MIGNRVWKMSRISSGTKSKDIFVSLLIQGLYKHIKMMFCLLGTRNKFLYVFEYFF